MSRAARPYIFGTLGCLVALIIILSIIPIPTPTISNSTIINGVLVGIEGDEETKDIVLKIEGDKCTYYINRGLDNDLDVASLRSQILNKNVSLYYTKSANLLAGLIKTRHLSRVQFEGELIYNEIEN